MKPKMRFLVPFIVSFIGIVAAGPKDEEANPLIQDCVNCGITSLESKLSPPFREGKLFGFISRFIQPPPPVRPISVNSEDQYPSEAINPHFVHTEDIHKIPWKGNDAPSRHFNKEQYFSGPQHSPNSPSSFGGLPSPVNINAAFGDYFGQKEPSSVVVAPPINYQPVPFRSSSAYLHTPQEFQTYRKQQFNNPSAPSDVPLDHHSQKQKSSGRPVERNTHKFTANEAHVKEFLKTAFHNTEPDFGGPSGHNLRGGTRNRLNVGHSPTPTPFPSVIENSSLGALSLINQAPVRSKHHNNRFADVEQDLPFKGSLFIRKEAGVTSTTSRSPTSTYPSKVRSPVRQSTLRPLRTTDRTVSTPRSRIPNYHNYNQDSALRDSLDGYSKFSAYPSKESISVTTPNTIQTHSDSIRKKPDVPQYHPAPQKASFEVENVSDRFGMKTSSKIRSQPQNPEDEGYISLNNYPNIRKYSQQDYLSDQRSIVPGISKSHSDSNQNIHWSNGQEIRENNEREAHRKIPEEKDQKLDFKYHSSGPDPFFEDIHGEEVVHHTADRAHTSWIDPKKTALPGLADIFDLKEQEPDVTFGEQPISTVKEAFPNIHHTHSGKDVTVEKSNLLDIQRDVLKVRERNGQPQPTTTKAPLPITPSRGFSEIPNLSDLQWLSFPTSTPQPDEDSNLVSPITAPTTDRRPNRPEVHFKEDHYDVTQNALPEVATIIPRRIKPRPNAVHENLDQIIEITSTSPARRFHGDSIHKFTDKALGYDQPGDEHYFIAPPNEEPVVTFQTTHPPRVPVRPSGVRKRPLTTAIRTQTLRPSINDYSTQADEEILIQRTISPISIRDQNKKRYEGAGTHVRGAHRPSKNEGALETENGAADVISPGRFKTPSTNVFHESSRGSYPSEEPVPDFPGQINGSENRKRYPLRRYYNRRRPIRPQGALDYSSLPPESASPNEGADFTPQGPVRGTKRRRPFRPFLKRRPNVHVEEPDHSAGNPSFEEFVPSSPRPYLNRVRQSTARTREVLKDHSGEQEPQIKPAEKDVPKVALVPEILSQPGDSEKVFKVRVPDDYNVNNSDESSSENYDTFDQQTSYLPSLKNQQVEENVPQFVLDKFNPNNAESHEVNKENESSKNKETPKSEEVPSYPPQFFDKTLLNWFGEEKKVESVDRSDEDVEEEEREKEQTEDNLKLDDLKTYYLNKFKGSSYFSGETPDVLDKVQDIVEQPKQETSPAEHLNNHQLESSDHVEIYSDYPSRAPPEQQTPDHVNHQTPENLNNILTKYSEKRLPANLDHRVVADMDKKPDRKESDIMQTYQDSFPELLSQLVYYSKDKMKDSPVIGDGSIEFPSYTLDLYKQILGYNDTKDSSQGQISTENPGELADPFLVKVAARKPEASRPIPTLATTTTTMRPAFKEQMSRKPPVVEEVEHVTALTKPEDDITTENLYSSRRKKFQNDRNRLRQLPNLALKKVISSDGYQSTTTSRTTSAVVTTPPGTTRSPSTRQSRFKSRFRNRLRGVIESERPEEPVSSSESEENTSTTTHPPRTTTSRFVSVSERIKAHNRPNTREEVLTKSSENIQKEISVERSLGSRSFQPGSRRDQLRRRKFPFKHRSPEGEEQVSAGSAKETADIANQLALGIITLDDLKSQLTKSKSVISDTTTPFSTDSSVRPNSPTQPSVDTSSKDTLIAMNTDPPFLPLEGLFNFS